MVKLNRKGFIGFMLTMAVGVAIGAAALVVSNEIARDKNAKKSASSTLREPSSAVNVEKAFEQYQKAYKEYQQAAGLGRQDVKKYSDAYKEAKKNLEIEILRNTPGVSEMDLSNLGKTNVESTQSANPFAVDSVSLNVGADGDATANDTPVTTVDQPSAAAVGEITGMNYYRVKAGDSLSKICESFYGNAGMWQHIVKYQMASIVSSPNLIFPGQLIVLPGGLQMPKISTPVSSDSSGDNTVAPAGDESWQESFQKDYLISDRSLTNSGSMTVPQIQKFLESKNSVLAKPYRGSTPAQMIYDGCKKYGINPQVILSRLQCEQGMISKTSASQHQLDWALGVGAYDSGDWNQKFKGLDKQIEYAAQTYRRHYDAAQAKFDKGEKITMTIDGQQVAVKNAATYSFYKYCPHFQGNKLFYDVWRGYRSKF